MCRFAGMRNFFRHKACGLRVGAIAHKSCRSRSVEGDDARTTAATGDPHDRRETRMAVAPRKRPLRAFADERPLWVEPCENPKLLGFRVSLFPSRGVAKPMQRDLKGRFSSNVTFVMRFHTTSVGSKHSLTVRPDIRGHRSANGRKATRSRLTDVIT